MSLSDGQKTIILGGLVGVILQVLRAWLGGSFSRKEEKTMELQPKMPLGIKESDEVVTLLITIAKAIVAAEADGKLDANDLAALMPVVLAVGPAVEGIAQVPAELWDLDSEEGAKLVGRVAVELALQNTHAKAIVIASLQMAVSAGNLVKVILQK